MARSITENRSNMDMNNAETSLAHPMPRAGLRAVDDPVLAEGHGLHDGRVRQAAHHDLGSCGHVGG